MPDAPRNERAPRHRPGCDPPESAPLRHARALDRQLRALARQEAKCRRVVGWIARVFLASQAYQALGFVRLGDYTRERLGLSDREIQSLAHVSSALDQLPALATAFVQGDVSWTQARILCEVATRATEGEWLERARTRSVRALEALVRHERAALPAAARATLDDCAEEGISLDGEAAVLVRLACPRRVRRLWRAAVELAERMAGARLAPWQAAEVIAAEGLSGARLRPAAERARRDGVHAAERGLQDGAQAAQRESGDGHSPMAFRARARATRCNPNERRTSGAAFDWPPSADAIPEDIWALGQGFAQADPWELDARLRRVVGAMRAIDAQMGRLLHQLFDDRIYQVLRFSSGAHYVRERLGISARKASGLVAIERKCAAVPTFAAAYHRGALSWVQALVLLPVVHEQTAGLWVARAGAATVRSLTDDVTWALDQGDMAAAEGPLAPPSAQAHLADLALQMRAPGTQTDASEIDDGGTLPIVTLTTDGGGMQMRAPETEGSGLEAAQRLAPAPELADVEIRFTAPLSVVALVRSALAAFAEPAEAPWQGLERLLAHVHAEWQRQPRHRDPIFARDGWRCAVAACSSRRNLHDHHILFRSRGGTNDRWNRVALCAWHHLRALHMGIIAARGMAPNDLYWSLGIRPGGAALLELLGDFYVTNDASEQNPDAESEPDIDDE